MEWPPGWECCWECPLWMLGRGFLFIFLFFFWGDLAPGSGDGWEAWVGCGEIQASPCSGGAVPGFWDVRGPPGVTPQLREGTRGRRTKQLRPDVRKQSRRGLGSASLGQGPPWGSEGVPWLKRGLSTWISFGNGRRDRTHQWKEGPALTGPRRALVPPRPPE